MSRYTKYNSSYILRKKHQETTKGTIFYRDWVTIGGFDRFSPGKTPYYKDGNFVFTTSNIPDYQKKHKYGEWVGEYTYEDVKNAKSETNEVKVNMTSNDLRDFAYFGSCVELVRASIESIISEFPAQITVTDIEIQKYTENDFKSVQIDGKNVYVIKNPFNIDLCHQNIVIENDMNPMRYMTYSYENYQLNGSDVTSYEVEFMSNYNDAMACPMHYQYETVITITINGSSKIYGILADSSIIYVSDDTSIMLRPKQEIIDEYFDNLKGFERQLLTRQTIPLYKNSFLTPIEGERGIKYVYRDYIFPSNDYQIDIESPSYVNYVNGLINIATLFDEYDTDNLYRSLTHEAIKNYDWSYTREYDDDAKEENIEGGTRVEQLLRLYGRVLDDIKRDIDGIKFTTNVTYNGYNNQADALLSDKLELSGWEVYSTIPVIEKSEEKDTGTEDKEESTWEDFFENTGIKWYSAYNYDNITTTYMDNEFMRRMLLNSKRILSSKGTIHAIEMVMGMFGFGADKGDFEIIEEYVEVDDLNRYEYTEEKREELRQINNNKNKVKLYEEDNYSGVPLKDIEITIYNENSCEIKTLTLPFYDKNKEYDGYLYFQSKGGWGSDGNETNNFSSYKETFNYLKTVSRISDLFGIDPNDIVENDIYYVVNIEDILEYDNTFDDLSNVHHTFYVTDVYHTKDYSGWRNTFYGDKDIQYKAKYLENVISLNINNNPHVGFGAYDNGATYIDYMKQPFKYSIDNNLLEQEDIDKLDTYSISDNLTDGKIKIIGKVESEDDIKYYLNMKVVTFINSIENELYKKYFNDVILNYIIQVIPSTTILILKGI